MPDHVVSGLGKLISQYSESENVKFLLQTFLEELQEIEDTNTTLILQDSIATAGGVQLDGIGEHLGKRREGLSDVNYRVALNIQKILNAGEGQFSTALQMWRTLLGSPTATMEEEFPAGVALYSDIGAPTLDQLSIFAKTLPITVTASITASYDGSGVFVFEGGVGGGFGTIHDPYIGGKLISRYSNMTPPDPDYYGGSSFIFDSEVYYDYGSTY